MKKEDEENTLPLKQKRLRQKVESRTKQKIKNLLHDSRPASEIAQDVEADDEWLE